MRLAGSRLSNTRTIFQSTHPLRGATVLLTDRLRSTEYFNPRTPCGVRPILFQNLNRTLSNFNPRPPCGVRLIAISGSFSCVSYFNPRTPCGVRRVDKAVTVDAADFNPRTPCGVRLYTSCMRWPRINISIHAPLAGCDETNRPEM